jgi:hypothetical protein
MLAFSQRTTPPALNTTHWSYPYDLFDQLVETDVDRTEIKLRTWMPFAIKKEVYALGQMGQ